jgi:hypothetical protein
MMRFVPGALGALALALVTGCGDNEARRVTPNAAATAPCPLAFPKAGLCASWTWKEAPKVRKVTEATLRFYERNGSPTEGPFRRPTVEVVVPSPMMPTMGHDSGKDPKTTAVAESPSDYRVENVYFNMRGKWTITIELRRGKTVIDAATLPLTL